MRSTGKDRQAKGERRERVLAAVWDCPYGPHQFDSLRSRLDRIVRPAGGCHPLFRDGVVGFFRDLRRARTAAMTECAATLSHEDYK